MAYDIMAPLLIVPKVETIYVIDLFDRCFSSDRTFEGQKNDIKGFLLNGSDEHSYSRKIHMEDEDPETLDESDFIHHLKHKSKIINDTDDGTVWRLKFKYGERQIDLIFYHHRDFLITWPDEIQNVGHVMTMGSFGWFCFEENDCTILIKMLETRTIKPFRFYSLWFVHKHFPYKLKIKSGMERRGEKIGMIEIDQTDYKGWIYQIYEPPENETFEVITEIKNKIDFVTNEAKKNSPNATEKQINEIMVSEMMKWYNLSKKRTIKTMYATIKAYDQYRYNK